MIGQRPSLLHGNDFAGAGDRRDLSAHHDGIDQVPGPADAGGGIGGIRIRFERGAGIHRGRPVRLLGSYKRTQELEHIVASGGKSVIVNRLGLRRRFLIFILIHHQCHTHLAHVAHARGSAAVVPGDIKGGKDDAHQQRDDRDHDEQLDKRKTVLIHGSTLF